MDKDIGKRIIRPGGRTRGSKNRVTFIDRGSLGEGLTFYRGSQRLISTDGLSFDRWSQQMHQNNIQDTAVGYEFTGQETESLSWTNRVESIGKRVEHGFSSFPYLTLS